MTRRLRYAIAVLALLAIAVYGVLAARRCAYPYELEWGEGTSLEEVRRVLAGEPIYTAPTLGFIALPYTPLYYYAGALSAALFGASFLAPRLVSIIASIACFACLYRIAARRARDPLAGVFAVGLFAASYRACGAWLDVARVDTLFLAWTLFAIDVLDGRRGARAAALCAALFFAAFFTKQSALLAAAVCTIALAFRSWREALAFAGTLAALVIATTIAFDARTDGWYRWYAFDLLAGHPLVPEMALRFWGESATVLAPALLVVTAASWQRRSLRANPEHTAFVPIAVAGLWCVAWISRAHSGGWDNTLMPAFAGTAMLFGPALSWTLNRGSWIAWVAALAAIAQLALLAYDPSAQLPTAADRRAGDALVERLRAIQGPVWMPDHGYLAERAGKAGSAYTMELTDLLLARDHDLSQRLVDEITRALTEKRFAAIVLDEPWDGDLPALAQNYRRTQASYDGERTFIPVTGIARRPSYWYFPR